MPMKRGRCEFHPLVPQLISERLKCNEAGACYVEGGTAEPELDENDDVTVNIRDEFGASNHLQPDKQAMEPAILIRCIGAGGSQFADTGILRRAAGLCP